MKQLLKLVVMLLMVNVGYTYGQDLGDEDEEDDDNDSKERFVTFRKEGANEWGLKNSSGVVILEPIYQYINGDMMNKYGIAVAKINSVRSIIDSTGRELLTGLDDAMNFFEDRAAVKRNGKWGYIDTKAQLVIDFQYETYTHFSDGNAVLSKLNPETQKIYYGTVDQEGKALIEFKYAMIDGFVQDRAGFKDYATQKWGIMDMTGKVLLPPTYSSLSILGDAYFIADNAGKLGLIDKNAKVMVPLKYDECDMLSDWLTVRVVLNGKVALIDIKTGTQIGQFYDDIGIFCSGLAMVTLNKKKGFMNKTGKVVIPIIYDDAKSFFDAGDSNVTNVEINGKVIVIDKTGKKVRDTDLLSVDEY